MRYRIGDIVTIVIDENTTASANLTDNNSERKQKGLGLDAARLQALRDTYLE
jgi:flagellar basal body L-ring protein FlgH